LYTSNAAAFILDRESMCVLHGYAGLGLDPVAAWYMLMFNASASGKHSRPCKETVLLFQLGRVH